MAGERAFDGQDGARVRRVAILALVLASFAFALTALAYVPQPRWIPQNMLTVAWFLAPVPGIASLILGRTVRRQIGRPPTHKGETAEGFRVVATFLAWSSAVAWSVFFMGAMNSGL
jgi:hypothetical protein